MQARRAQELDTTGRVVMPGFVDCHAHLVYGAPCNGHDDLLTDDVSSPVQHYAAALNVLRSSSSRRLELRASQFANGMARHGTTSLESTSGHGLDQRGELKILRVQAKLDRAPLDVVSTFLTPRECPAEFENRRDEYFSWMCADLLPAIRRRGLARFFSVRCGGPLFSVQQVRGLLEAARGLGFGLKVQGSGEGVRLAAESEAISVEVPDGGSSADWELLSRSRAMAVLTPGTQAPARNMIESGVGVALGSNFNPSARSTYSMLYIVALACADLGLLPAEAICAATVNAAYAIGVGQAAGSIEVGKPADLIVLNAADYREIPRHFGVNLVHTTIKRGATIYQEGKVAR
ncbi:MAG TPA: amidohydrolase family protein [Bryobacteraceae bacterium]|nr:amidohydrolase family protein [Bryobacteraceae bacterium]